MLWLYVIVVIGQEWVPAWQDTLLSPTLGSADWNTARTTCSTISSGCRASLPQPKETSLFSKIATSEWLGIYQPFYWGEHPLAVVEPLEGWFYLDLTPIPNSSVRTSQYGIAYPATSNCAYNGGATANDYPCGWSLSFRCQISTCFDQWEVSGDKEFKIFHISKTWSDARAYCRSLNPPLESDLVSPASQETRKLIENMPFSSVAWIGITKDSFSGIWVYLDGSVVSSNETAQFGLSSGCVATTKNSIWSVSNCFVNRYFICQRKRCLPGSSIEKGTCGNCTSGRYSTKVNELNCTRCEAGEYQESSGQTFCRSCPAGRYSLSGFSGCLGCLQGQYQDTTGQSSCKNCPDGFSSEMGSVQCGLCPIGFFPNGTDGCVPCEEQGTTTGIGSTVCVCKDNNFGVYPACRPCPSISGVSCPLNSLYPQLGSGLWIDEEDPSIITKCLPSEACLRTFGNMTECSPGYGGLFCSQCLHGFFRSNSMCQKCGRSVFAIMLVILLFFLIVLLSIRFLQSDGTLPVDWKICLNWVQILSFFPELALSWPSNMKALFSIAAFSNLNIELFSPECSVSISSSQGFHMKANLLWIFAGILVSSIAIQHLASRTNLKKWIKVQSFKLTLCKLFNALTLIYVSLFTYTILSVFAPVRCAAQADGRSLMTSDLAVECGSREWKPLFNSMLVYGMIYLVVFPLIIASLFWRFREQIGSAEEQMLIGGLTRPYKKDFFWWEIVNVAKKIALTLALSLPSSSRNIVFFAILVLFMCFEIMVRPFKLDIQSQLNSLWSLLTLLIMGTGLSAKAEGTIDSLSLKVFSSLVIVIFCLVLAFSLRSLVSLFLHKSQKKKHQEQVLTSSTGIATATQTVPITVQEIKLSTEAQEVTRPLNDENEIKIYRLSDVLKPASV